MSSAVDARVSRAGHAWVFVGMTALAHACAHDGAAERRGTGGARAELRPGPDEVEPADAAREASAEIPALDAADGDAGSATVPEPEPDAGGAAAAPRARFHCFGWVHGPDFSTDCFRQKARCEQARLEMKRGSRDVMPACSVDAGAWCTRVSRPPSQAGSERCFGSAGNCARYQSYVQGNGLTTTACVAK